MLNPCHPQGLRGVLRPTFSNAGLPQQMCPGTLPLPPEGPSHADLSRVHGRRLQVCEAAGCGLHSDTRDQRHRRRGPRWRGHSPSTASLCPRGWAADLGESLQTRGVIHHPLSESLWWLPSFCTVHPALGTRTPRPWGQRSFLRVAPAEEMPSLGTRGEGARAACGNGVGSQPGKGTPRHRRSRSIPTVALTPRS